MRIAAFIAAIAVSNVVVIGGAALIALTGPDVAAPLIWLSVSSLMLLVYAPLIAGSLLSYWDVRASPGTARYFRRWFVGLGIAQAIGVVAALLFGVLTGTAWWLTPLSLAAAALLDLLAVRLGGALRRREEALAPGVSSWAPMTRQQIVRRILLAVGVFVVVLLVAGTALSVLLTVVATGRDRSEGLALLFAVEFAFLAAGLVCTTTSLRLQRQVREQVTRDVDALRRIGKVVVRRTRIELEPDEEVLAARWAAITAVSLPFTLAFTCLLYAALAAQQVEQILSGPIRPFSIGLLVFLVVALVVLTPLQAVRIRRVRAYARAHAALIREAPPSA